MGEMGSLDIKAGNVNDRGGSKKRKKTRQVSDQDTKFNIKLCVYIGKTTGPILCFS